jgi:CheY-like chemotaxis protein
MRRDSIRPDREVTRVAKGRILVVDDEIYIVHILDFSLGMEGYEVVTALDGEQALERVAEQKPISSCSTS